MVEPFEAADRGHDDDRAVLALDHLRHHHAGQPVVGDDVVVEDLAELVVGNAGERTVIGIRRGVADQHVDLAEGAVGLVDEVLQIFLAGDVGGDRDRRALAELVVDLLRHRSQTSCLREEITTLAPCSAIRSAMARPMPRVEPVMTATFPVMSNKVMRFSRTISASSAPDFDFRAKQLVRAQLRQRRRRCHASFVAGTTSGPAG